MSSAILKPLQRNKVSLKSLCTPLKGHEWYAGSHLRSLRHGPCGYLRSECRTGVKPTAAPGMNPWIHRWWNLFQSEGAQVHAEKL